jgi:hypothetical protein
MTLAMSSTVVVAADVLSSELGSEHVLLNLSDGVYYGLEAAGSEIWRLVQRPITVAEICRIVSEAYDVEPERCRADVIRLLSDMAERRLVDVRTDV